MKIHSFNDAEGLRIAVEMEKRGGDYYRRAARISKSRETVDFLNLLAAEEDGHMRDFSRLLECACRDKGNECYNEEANAYLSAVASDVVFSGGLVELGSRGGFDSPRAILEGAIDSEKDSILFYGELERVAFDEKAKRVFHEIALQEQSHLRQLGAMLAQLDK